MEMVWHNSDLLSEILQWLPAESLLKFRSVCKEWLSLISSLVSSHEFRKQHTNRRLKLQQSLIIHSIVSNPQLFHLNPNSRRMMSFDLSLPDAFRPIILQSSNGLLLLKPDYYEDEENYYLFVHNPATKQSRKIIPTRSTTHPHVADVALAFDPSKSPYYELVCFRRSSKGWEPARVSYRIEVYSSKSHTWNKGITLEPNTLPTLMGLLISFSCSLTDNVRVYWDNAVYWSSGKESYYCCFDIAKGEWKTLPRPPSDHHYFCRRLQESNGHLYHIELIGKTEAVWEVEVWELESGGDDDDDDHHHHWLLRHHHVLPVPPQWEWKWRYPSILTFSVETCILLIRWYGRIRVYNLSTGSYGDFLDATGKPFFDRGYDLRAFQFRGTLALV